MMLPILIGVAVGAGSLLGAKAALDQGNEAKRAAEFNARIARMAAQDALLRGAADAGRARMLGSRTIAQQQAVLGASGVDPSAGTAITLAQASRGGSELDALMIKNNAARQAWGLRMQAQEMIRQGEAAQQLGRVQAIGSLLGGAGRIAGLGYEFGWWGGGKGA